MKHIKNILLLILLTLNLQGQDYTVITHNNQIVEFTSFTYDSSALAYFARMTTPPSTEFKDRVNTFIIAQKASGLWDKKAVIVYLGAETSQAATLNMKGDFNNATFVNNPTFTANDGVTADVGYINSNFNPTTHGGTIVTQNSFNFTYYKKVAHNTTAFDWGCADGTQWLYGRTRTGSSGMFGRINSPTAFSGGNVGEGLGIFRCTLNGGRAVAFQNLVAKASDAAYITTALLNLNIIVGGYTDGSTVYINGVAKYGYYEIGAGLTNDEALLNYNQIKALVQYNP